MKKILFAIMGVALCIAHISAQELTESFSDISAISLSTSIGHCRLIDSDTDEVVVTVYYDEEEVEPVFLQQDEKLNIKEEKLTENMRSSIEWILALPEGIDIDINSGTGNLEGEVFDGRVHANLGTGNVAFSELDGLLDINTGTGNVVLGRVSGKVKLNTGTGKISINVAVGEMDLNSGTGNVDIGEARLAGENHFNSGTGNASVVIHEMEEDLVLSVNSGTGDAELKFDSIPIAGKIEMKCHSQKGKLVSAVDFDSEEILSTGEHNTRVGYINQGNSGAQIVISTGTGKAILK